ncbi:MAG: dihydrodipicolinate synthase family protein [Rhizobiaceae bacterium]
MTTDVFRGCVPALMTPCNERGEPDLDALVRRGVELVAKGMSGVVFCGSMGDWPLLDDAVRMEGVALLVKAGVPVIVGTGAQNTRLAAAHAAYAAEVGASGLMIIPRLLSRGSSQAAQKHHFKAVLEAGSGLPSVIYNSPWYGYETRAELFFQLRAEHANLVGFKEFGGARSLTYAAENITGQDRDLMLLVGVDTQVCHGFLDCGAVGAITGIGNVLPDAVLQLVDLCRKGASGDARARRRALELEAALAVLSSFDEGPDLVLYYKYLMLLQGDEAYRHHFNAFDTLTQSQMTHAERQFRQFTNWHEAWMAIDA